MYFILCVSDKVARKELQFFRVHAGEVVRFVDTQLPKVCDLQYLVDTVKLDDSVDHSNEFMLTPHGQVLPSLLFPCLIYATVALSEDELDWINGIGGTAECALYGFESSLAVESLRKYLRVGGNYAFVPVSFLFYSYLVTCLTCINVLC